MNLKEYYKLCEEIWEHNRRYFLENAPAISDYEYDQLLLELFEIEKKHPEWVYPGSPTQRVGEGISSGFAVVSHSVPMLSLANTYSPDELKDFIERMQRLLNKKEVLFTSELKMDGIAISIRYEEGTLIRGMTRGNGKEGEEITQNLMTIKSLPTHLKGNYPKVLEVRGEVFMPLAAFIDLNRHKELDGEALFANPRNATGGSLKLLDVKEVSKRKLDFVCHGIAEMSSDALSSHFEALDYLNTLGLPIISEKRQCYTFEDMWAFATDVEKKRKHLPFEIDGIVVKVDDLLSQKKLGVTGKNYRWAVAYKFSPEQAQTVIREITVQVGRTGVLTPVAELDPIRLAGSMISRATLHNEDEVKRKDIRVGDSVIIEKGGDVIPKVVQVVLEKRPENTKPWSMPLECPACGSRVSRNSNEVAVRCSNAENCPAQGLRRLLFFVGKTGMDIDHLGERIVMQLVEKGFIKRLSDIYHLKEEQLYELNNFKEKSVRNLLASIEKSKDVTLGRFIMALGIKHVGAETAEMLAQKCGNLEVLAKMTDVDLLQLDGIGEKVAESIVNFFADRDHLEEIERLLDAGVAPRITEVTEYKDHPFYGKNFVLTGALHHYTRDGAATLIRERGGKISSNVNKQVDYVIVGEDPGSKYEKAKKLAITILSEEEFTKMINTF